MSTERDPPRLLRGGEGVPVELSRALSEARGRVPAASVLAAVAARLPGGPGGGPDGGGVGGAGSLPVAAVVSAWPGVFLGAALGALVGGISLLVPVEAAGPGVSSRATEAPASSGAPRGSGAGASGVGSSGAAPGEPAALGEPGSALAPGEPGSGSAPASTSTSASVTASPSTGAPSSSAAEGAAGAAGAAGGPGVEVEREAESDYLRRAHAQLSSSPGQALSLAEAHPIRYPGGKLSQERELIVVSALAALGRTAEAQARARVFFARYPDSAHRRRLQVLLPGLGEPEKKPSP